MARSSRAGRLGRLAVPYLRVIVPGLLMVLGFVGLVELTSFLTIGAAQGKTLVLFGNKIDMHATLPWLVATLSLLAASSGCGSKRARSGGSGTGLMVELKPQRSVA